jgi:copper chaperone CopZ
VPTSTEIVTLAVTGMTCGSCRAHVERALAGVEGVEQVSVDLAAGRAEATVTGATPEIRQRLMDAVIAAGYGAGVPGMSAGQDNDDASHCAR